MNNTAIADTRNVAFLGHTGSGKTALVDALLYKLGINDRLGSSDSGSSMSDFTDEEKARKISIFAKPFSGSYKVGGKTMSLTFTDTPGYLDFFGQVIAAARSTDAGIIVVDASSGVEVGTRHAWRACNNRGLSARAIVISGVDKDNTDFEKTVSEVQAAFGNNCLPVVLPTADASAVVDVLAAKDVPDDLADRVAEVKGGLVELAAETDDSLLEKFFADEELSADEIASGLRNSVASGGLVPIFATVAAKDLGIAELLDGVGRLLPSPADHDVKDADDNVIGVGNDDPFVGLIWRSVNDAFVGQMSFVRVLGGTLKADSEVNNSTKGQKERVGSLLVVNGKKQGQVDAATAGDIVAVPKLKASKVGDTLCSLDASVKCRPIDFPSPVTFMSVEAKTQADEDKIGVALTRICEEDPTLTVDRNVETKQVVLQGLGDVHIDVGVERMKSVSNVNVSLSTPKVPYRETVTALGEGHYKHKKQSGGHGQFGEVFLRVEPLPDGDEEDFVNAVVGGSIPSNFIPAVQKGLVEGKTAGAVAGYPVERVKVTVYDGKHHPVDSSEVAFKIAGSRALREAMAAAKPVLLEPIMTVKVMLPDDCLGDINGDLNHKRGRIMGMEPQDGMQVITAEVPHAELFRYAAELRSMTGGRGSFSMEFCRYDVVPSNVAQKVVAAAQKEKEEG